MACAFCDRIRDGEHHVSSEHAVAFPDAYPVSRGHTLVVPKRHISTIYDLAEDQQADLWELVRAVRHSLLTEQCAGFNIGVNDGVAAGQTVAHAHVHVIPRYENDVEDPRGGIRWVVPPHARYWQ